jgi:hypothetical protein
VSQPASRGVQRNVKIRRVSLQQIVVSLQQNCHRTNARSAEFSNQPAEASGPMSNDHASFADVAKQRQADHRIEFWLHVFFAFILALALVASTICCLIVHKHAARRIAANVAKLPELLRNA